MPLHPKQPPISTPQGSLIYYQGPDISLGPMPTLIYFSLSALSTLYEDPFNQPVVALKSDPLRIFSWDLPFHSAEANPKWAMEQWGIEFGRNPRFIADFIEECMNNISYLIEQGLIDPYHLGVAGLSRGAFIATHLAACDKRIQNILGFAPLTQPRPLEEFAHLNLKVSEQDLALTNLADALVDKHLRFYIGNHDIRVGTEACFSFIKTLVNKAVEQGIKSPPVELIIYPSIGYKGHGTPPPIFQDGAQWIKHRLIQS